MADETEDDRAGTVAAALEGVKTVRATADFEKLLDAEQILLRAAVAGEWARVGAAAGRAVDIRSAADLVAVRPDAPIKHGPGANVIRADFLRHLILGGCPEAPLHPRGLYLIGAWIDGTLDLRGCTAPSLVRLWGCHFEKTINLHSATLKTVGLDGSRIATKTTGVALEAINAKIEGDLTLRDGFHATGTSRLLGATITGTLDCDGGRFEAEANGDALQAARSTIGGSALLRDGFHATGTVGLLGANFTGNLDCSSGRFEAEVADKALIADSATIGSSALFRNSFHATGTVRLIGSNITGDLDCDGGRFEAEANGDAIHAAGATIGGNALFRDGFHATGTVGLHGSNITGNLDCDGGRFEAAKSSHALIGQNMAVSHLFRMAQPPADADMFTGELFLNGATVGALSDSEACLPARGVLRIRDFTYDRIFDAPDTAAARARWLRLQPANALGTDFQPQPWDQVETVLRAQGRPLEARRIGEMREWARLKAFKVYLTARGKQPWRTLGFALLLIPNLLIGLAYLLYGVLTGFGYFTSRTLIPFLVFWLLGAVLFEAAWREGAMAPPQAFVLANDAWRSCEASHPDNPAACWTAEQAAGARYYRFEPLLYSFDVFLPVLSLEQEESWEPSAGFGAPIRSAAAIDDVVDDWLGNWAAGSVGPLIRNGFAGAASLFGAGEATIGDVGRFYRRLHEMMGYLLSGFLLAGAARLVRQE